MKATESFISEASPLMSHPLAQEDPLNKLSFHLTTKADIEEEKAHKIAVQKSIEEGIKRREEDAKFLRD
jgi:hypothetical protein